jgi:predicted dehydrogenase
MASGSVRSSRLSIGVIGYGYWGPNLVRNLRETDRCDLACVCDLREDRLRQLARMYPGVRTQGDWLDLVRDTRIDAVVVATNVSTHYEFALEALYAGKHVLVEKPLALSERQAAELVEVAEARRLVLMVGHTFVYSAAVRRIRQLVDDRSLGDLLYYDSTRANLGILQDDINVFWDLAPHDLSILDCLVGCQPEAVSATGASHTNRNLADIGFMTLHYPDGFIAHISVNWLSPVKLRTILLGGTECMVVYDDTVSAEKLRIYSSGVERNGATDKRHNELLRRQAGDAFVPKLDTVEPLRAEVLDFIESIEDCRVPLADGRSGLRVVRLLENACVSMARDGRPVELASMVS